MQKCEQPRSRCIRGINENDWGKWVADGESPKLANVEFPMGVVANHATAHHQNTDALSSFDELLLVNLPGSLALLKFDS